MPKVFNIAAFLALCFLTEKGYSTPFEISYGGRLVDSAGKSVTGPLTLGFKLFRLETAGTKLEVDIPDIAGVQLVDGVFQVTLTLSDSDAHTAFSSSEDLYIEVTDVTNQTTYPRQKFTAVPYALKVPVDNESITYDGQGKLKFNQIKELKLKQEGGDEHVVTIKPNASMAQAITFTLPQTEGPDGFYLKSNGSGNLDWGSPAGAGNMNTDTYDDSPNNGVVDNSEALEGEGKAYYRNVDNHISGSTNRVFSQADHNYLYTNIEDGADKTDSGNVNAAGAIMHNDLSGVGFVKRTGSEAYTIDTNTYLTSATDDVGNINVIDGKWCTSLASKVDCNLDPLVGTQSSGKWCTSNGTSITCSADIPWDAPPAIGATTAGTGEFTTLTARTSVRLNDDDASNFLSIQAPADLANDLTVYTLPATPDDGKVLMTDSNGVLSWESLDQVSGTIDGGNITGNGSISDTVLSPNVSLLGQGIEASELTGTGTLPAFNGSALTNLNGSNIASGTVADARLSSTVTNLGDTIEATEMAGTGTLPAFNGSALTNLNGSNIASGTVADARLSSTVTNLGDTIEATEMAGTGTLPAFNGSALTNLNGSNIASGTISEARIHSDITRDSELASIDTIDGPLTVGTSGQGSGGGQSTSQGNSTDWNNAKFIEAPWIYANAIEASDERGSGSTLITVGKSAYNATTTGADTISLVTDGAARLFVKSNGNVGIGETNPDKKLDVSGDIILDNKLLLRDDDTNYLAIQAPSALPDNNTIYTFPASPTAGAFLKTDGNGALSWNFINGADITTGTLPSSRLSKVSTTMYSPIFKGNPGTTETSFNAIHHVNDGAQMYTLSLGSAWTVPVKVVFTHFYWAANSNYSSDPVWKAFLYKNGSSVGNTQYVYYVPSNGTIGNKCIRSGSCFSVTFNPGDTLEIKIDCSDNYPAGCPGGAGGIVFMKGTTDIPVTW